MVIVDADGHVEEPVAMFGYLEKDFYDRRPLAPGFATDTILGPNNAVWLIDGTAYPKLVGKGGVRFATPTPDGGREAEALVDPGAGIDGCGGSAGRTLSSKDRPAGGLPYPLPDDHHRGREAGGGAPPGL